MIGLAHYLTLAGLLFAIAVAGIFINRKNVILLLMCIELNRSNASEYLEYQFDMSIRLRRAHPKVKGHAGKVAVTRGPLVYCLESVDNPNVDIFTAQLDPLCFHDEFVPDLLGGCVVIHAKTTDGRSLKFIPYFLWANRGASQMTVWVHSK